MNFILEWNTVINAAIGTGVGSALTGGFAYLVYWREKNDSKLNEAFKRKYDLVVINSDTLNKIFNKLNEYQFVIIHTFDAILKNSNPNYTVKEIKAMHNEITSYMTLLDMNGTFLSNQFKNDNNIYAELKQFNNALNIFLENASNINDYTGSDKLLEELEKVEKLGYRLLNTLHASILEQ